MIQVTMELRFTSLQIKSASLQYYFQYRTELLEPRIAACAECGKHEDHGY
jgi:hypothetical protein